MHLLIHLFVIETEQNIIYLFLLDLYVPNRQCYDGVRLNKLLNSSTNHASR